MERAETIFTQVVAKNSWSPDSDGMVFDTIHALGGPMLAERSAKLTNGGLEEGRYIISIPKSSLYPGPKRQMRGICQILGAPEEGYELIAPHIAASNSIHFGYEPGNNGDIVKCYLEFSPDDTPETGLVFLSLKWASGIVPTEAWFTISRYWSRSGLPHSGKRALIDAILSTQGAREAAHQFLDIARNSGIDGAATLLEVEEPGNPRSSIDINLADSGRRLNDLRELLGPVFDEAQLGPVREDFFAREGMAPIGHFAAGTSRDGAPFSTLYFGAEAIQCLGT